MRKVKASGSVCVKIPNHVLHTLPETLCWVFNVWGFSVYFKTKGTFQDYFFEINSCSFRESLYLLLKLHPVLLESLQLLQQVAWLYCFSSDLHSAVRSRSCYLIRRTWHVGHNTVRKLLRRFYFYSLKLIFINKLILEVLFFMYTVAKYRAVLSRWTLFSLAVVPDADTAVIPTEPTLRGKLQYAALGICSLPCQISLAELAAR